MSHSVLRDEDTDGVFEQILGLQEYLAEHLRSIDEVVIGRQRQAAKEKLTKLSKLQFKELSTDVYDEMRRRFDQQTKPPGQHLPFLPVREDYHPKRNQTRQKLATLPEDRYKELASDVYFELTRRHPSIKEAVDKKIQQKAEEKGKSTANVAKDNKVELRKTVELNKDHQSRRDRVTSEIDSEASLNFESLDNLMADLGSMITPSTKSAPQSPRKPDPTPSQTQVPRLVPKADPPQLQPQPQPQAQPQPVLIQPISIPTQQQQQQNQDITKSILEEAQKTNSLIKAQHAIELAEIREKNNQKIQRMEEEFKSSIQQYEKKIKELEDELKVAKADKANGTKAQEESQVLIQQNQELSEKLSEYQQKGRGYEEQIRKMNEELKDVKDQLNNMKSKYDKQLSENSTLTSKLSLIVDEYSSKVNSKENELHSKNKEVRDLTDERNNAIMERNEMKVEVMSLREEVRSLKKRIEVYESQENDPTSEKGRRNLDKQKSSASLVISVTEEIAFGEGVKDLSRTIQELLEASRVIDPNKILNCMKSIVMTVRRYLDDAEEFEKNNKNLSQEQKENLSSIQSEISEKLTALVALAKAHASGKNEILFVEMMKKIENTSMSLSNALNRLTKSMVVVEKGRKHEYEVENFAEFVDNQTKVVIQSIQSMLFALKNPNLSKEGFLASVDPLVSALQLLKNVVEYNISKQKQVNRETLEYSLQQVSNSVTKLLNVREMFTSTSRPSNQVIASVAFDIAKYTKELVLLTQP